MLFHHIQAAEADYANMIPFILQVAGLLAA